MYNYLKKAGDLEFRFNGRGLAALLLKDIINCLTSNMTTTGKYNMMGY